jgi:alkanesulfonate monooxygenase SsuD/methylene tetrahydromethanopterin reductase-like flavin-dependent oxidoreductase (luciferase family)
VFLTNDFDAARKGGSVIAGTPDTVREEMARHIEETGVNYVLCQFAFGNISHEAEMRSLKLFATEVMPHLATPEIVPLPAPARRARARAGV